MLAVAESGGQAALLAPTEVLAAQHLRSISRVLGPDLSAELMPTLVTGQMPAAERRRAALRVVTGQARIVVGTHALLSESTEFYDLGLVVVDEQHRFGVEQRELLRRKGTAPHTLVMTATPIPRTVAMTVFGDLETSTIRSLPSGRAPITSHVVPLAEKPRWLPNVWRRAGEEIAQGRQGYVICPAIGANDEEGELLTPEEGAVAPATVTGVLADLRTQPALQGARIEALTGRMSGEEKEAVMTAFAEGRIDLLVATTVVEVGVDVPAATIMVIENAERFGLAQLHQLRGRIGRGAEASTCLLLYHEPLGEMSKARLKVIRETTDGFRIAEEDLKLRGEGDVLGIRQSGLPGYRIARSEVHAQLITQARDEALRIMKDNPKLRGERGEALRCLLYLFERDEAIPLIGAG
jgi:ATP-dependent DNA helicase RecG